MIAALIVVGITALVTCVYLGLFLAFEAIERERGAK